jgi:hypothetical protein
MLSPTPPESSIVIVLPSITTTHESVLAIRLPFLLNAKQSNPVTSTNTSSHQLSVAVDVYVMGASGGIIV